MKANYIFKELEPEDIDGLWGFLNRLDSETNYMMYEPGEREQHMTRAGFERYLQACVIQGEDCVYLAVDNGEIVGYIHAERGRMNRIHHTAYIVVGILESHRGQGIGTALFAYLDQWAKENQISRLELTVECPNQVAKRLYEKSGFAVEGIRKNAMCVDGQLVDEYYMAKIL